MSSPLSKLSRIDITSYAALGFAMGAVAVPLYIQVPFLYTRTYGLPVQWVSTILLLTRLLDAILDPLLGVWVDRLKQRWGHGPILLLSAPLLVAGMWGVFKPLGGSTEALALSLTISLIIVHLGYSLAMITYLAWGSEIQVSDETRAKLVSARESVGILGVVIAVSLPAAQFSGVLLGIFIASLVLGLSIMLMRCPRPPVVVNTSTASGFQAFMQDVLLPMKRPAFRALALVFVINGIAGSLPATLVQFFFRDYLQLPDTAQPILGVYFFVGALSTLFWVPLATKIGLIKSWMLGMALTILAFLGVSLLEPGDLWGYTLICILTGLAFGADLAFPTTLLAKVIAQAGDQNRFEGAYFGLWNWISKFNLAIAPALALPALAYFGYDASSSLQATERSADTTQNTAALVIFYAVIPCGLKALAIFAVWRQNLRVFDHVSTDNDLPTPESRYKA